MAEQSQEHAGRSLPSDPALRNVSPASAPGVGFTLLITLGLLVLVEIGLRLAGMDPRQALVNAEGPYVRHETRHWALQPGYDRDWAGSHVQINDKGLRDRPIDWAKPAGEIRVLLLGGSVTFGYGVAVEDSYARRLESILSQEKTLSGHAIRTINSGVGGYGTMQEVQYFREDGVRYSPDIVVMDFGLNDVLERYLVVDSLGGTGVYRGGKQTEIDLVEPKTKVEAALRFLKNLPKKTAFYSLARAIKVRLVARRQGEQEIKDQLWMTRKMLEESWSPKMQEAWDQTIVELKNWADLARQGGARPVLMVFPDRLQLTSSEHADKPQRLLRQFAEVEGIGFVDLLPAFRGKDLNEYFLDEDHPSAKGHAVAAEELARGVLASLRPSPP